MLDCERGGGAGAAHGAASNAAGPPPPLACTASRCPCAFCSIRAAQRWAHDSMTHQQVAQDAELFRRVAPVLQQGSVDVLREGELPREPDSASDRLSTSRCIDRCDTCG